jgi:nicotinamidase-related amidase
MKTALVLVDIQNDYFPGGNMELTGADKASANAAKLLDRARQSSWPVFHVQHLSTRPGATFFIPGTPGAEFHEDVRPLPGETVITKHYPNSFRETNLQELLRGACVERLIICGMMSHMCIDATVRAAFDLGFACTVAYDACTTKDLDFLGIPVPAAHVQASFMAALGAVYARITGTEEIVSTL